MPKPGSVLHACCLAPEDDPHASDCPERRCDREYPGTRNLTCLKPTGHDGSHATCLNYDPEWDRWEWDEWNDSADV